jgi:glutamate N-acetyltransferase / amino-acid N-acetyltransferase
MIAPDMATMLAYIFTDARIDARDLDRHAAGCRSRIVQHALGRHGHEHVGHLRGHGERPGRRRGWRCLRTGPRRGVHPHDRDAGPGRRGRDEADPGDRAGRCDDEDARVLARCVVDSPLIKTMVHGADPNVGRILMAVGKCLAVEFRPEAVAASINGVPVVAAGRRAGFDESRVRRELAGDTVDLHIDLGAGDAGATAFGCDLTDGYIRENAAYYSS